MAQILIVDDEENFRIALREILEIAGHEVLEAEGGEVALEVYSRCRTELVMTDINMPGKDGIEIIMELRSKYPGVKIIAMSGGGIENPRIEIAKHLGADRILDKPFYTDEILEAVNLLLKQ